MGLFRKKKSIKFEFPQSSIKTNPNILRKATTRFSSTGNNVFVGYKVGAGKFARRLNDPKKISEYSSKLLKMKKGFTGKGEDRGVQSTPLYINRNKLSKLRSRRS